LYFTFNNVITIFYNSEAQYLFNKNILCFIRNKYCLNRCYIEITIGSKWDGIWYIFP
jgi:hypothetical protein